MVALEAERAIEAYGTCRKQDQYRAMINMLVGMVLGMVLGVVLGMVVDMSIVVLCMVVASIVACRPLPTFVS